MCLLLENITNNFPQVELLSAFEIFNPQSLPSCAPADAKRKQLLHVILHYNLLLPAVMLADQYSQAAAREVLHDLAGNKLKLVYPQLAHLASLGLTKPFSTTDSERAFSTMNRVKAKLKNRLKATTLDCLLRISMQDPKLYNFDFKLTLKKWSTIKNRRISTSQDGFPTFRSLEAFVGNSRQTVFFLYLF